MTQLTPRDLRPRLGSARLVSDPQDGTFDSADGGISMNLDALKLDLFKQSVEVRR